jgi:DNA polymerase
VAKEFSKPLTCLECPAYSLGISYTTPRGPKDAEIALIGQGPGEEEARLGKPFVGKSGWMISKWLRAAKVVERLVYIDNVVRCRLVITNKDGEPIPGKTGGLQNRTPTMAEMRYCWGVHGLVDLKKVKPKVVLTAGVPATTMLLGRKGRVGMIGNVFEVEL